MPDKSSPVSLREIARKAGVSVATVSLALKNHKRISAATREQIQQLAREMGYRPSTALSKAMRSARTGGKSVYQETIACVSGGPSVDKSAARGENSLDFQNHAFHTGFTRRAEELGCAINYFSLQETSLPQLLRIFRARGIERVIILGQREQYEIFKELNVFWQEYPCVTLGVRDIYWVGGPIVRLDYFAAGRLAFYQAWQAGYRRFHLQNTVLDLNTDRRFEAGFRFAASYLAPRARITVLEDRRGIHLSGREDLNEEDCLIGGMAREHYPPMIEHMRQKRFAWLDWHANLHRHLHPFSGIDQQDALQAQACVDLILSRGSTSPPAPTAAGREIHLVEPGWVTGDSLPELRNNHLNFLPDEPYRECTGESFTFVSLTGLAGEEMSRDASWMVRLRIPPIPRGTWSFHGVPFQLTNDSGGRMSTVRFISGNPPEAVPAVAHMEVPVSRKARNLYFLHAGAYCREFRQLATYKVVYEDGSDEALPVVSLGDPPKGCDAYPSQRRNRANIQDWYPEAFQFRNTHARSVCIIDCENVFGQPGYFYTLRWENPHPSKIIRKLVIQAHPGAGSAILLFLALTLGAS